MPRSHSSRLSASWADGIFRTRARSIPIVCSAADTTLPYGALATTTPWREQASTSILSTPTPARPRKRRRRAWPRNSVSTVVDERVMIASKPATFSKSSARGILDETCSTSNPRSARYAIPSCAIASMTRTRMALCYHARFVGPSGAGAWYSRSGPAPPLDRGAGRPACRDRAPGDGGQAEAPERGGAPCEEGYADEGRPRGPVTADQTRG